MLKKGVPEWMSSGSSIWSSLSSSLSPKSKPNSPLSESASPGTRTGPESETPSSPPALEPPLLQSPPVRVAGGDPSRSEEISLQSQLLAELSKKVIDLGELRRLASQGIPDGAGIRSTVWKLVLGYLPNDRSLWVQELSKKRSQYKAFKEDFLVNPSEIAWILDETAGRKDEELDNEGKGLLSRSQITHGEHPLSLGQTSVWNKFFQDTEIIEQIDRDVKRTHPDMHFFSGDSSLAKSNQEALKHILIIFAKLNPGIKYVQGMNEVLAPLYYVFRSDPDENNAAHAEADTFFCFVELLSGFRDNFCQKLDNSVVGIRSTLSKLMQLLKTHDGELWSHLEITTKFQLCSSLQYFVEHVMDKVQTLMTVKETMMIEWQSMENVEISMGGCLISTNSEGATGLDFGDEDGGCNTVDSETIASSGKAGSQAAIASN